MAVYEQDCETHLYSPHEQHRHASSQFDCGLFGLCGHARPGFLSLSALLRQARVRMYRRAAQRVGGSERHPLLRDALDGLAASDGCGSDQGRRHCPILHGAHHPTFSELQSQSLLVQSSLNSCVKLRARQQFESPVSSIRLSDVTSSMPMESLSH